MDEFLKNPPEARVGGFRQVLRGTIGVKDSVTDVEARQNFAKTVQMMSGFGRICRAIVTKFFAFSTVASVIRCPIE